MLRSFAYAASARRDPARRRRRPRAGRSARASAFLDGVLRARRRRACCRTASSATERLLRIFELEKAVYELRYELNNRPDWVRIPVAGHRPPARGADRMTPSDARAALVARDARATRTRCLGAHPRRRRRRRPRLPARRPSASRVLGRRRPSRSSSSGPSRRALRGRRRRAPSCRCATSSRSPTPTATTFTLERPVPLPADARRARPAPRRRGPPRGALREARRARARARRRRAARRSRSGRRPRASVSVVGDFNSLGRAPAPDALARLDRASGSCSSPASSDGARYKFEIRTQDGDAAAEGRPVRVRDRDAAARPRRSSTRSRHEWGDDDVARARARERDAAGDGPMSIYEVHLGSWRRDPREPDRC